VFSQIVPLQAGLSLPQGRRVDDVLEVGVVEALLSPERDFTLDLLSQANKLYFRFHQGSISSTFYAQIFCMNIVSADFLYLHVHRKSCQNNIQTENLYIKNVDEIDNWGQFCLHFTLNFLVRKCFVQLFSSYSLAL